MAKLVKVAKAIVPEGRFKEWLKLKRSTVICRNRLHSNNDVGLEYSEGRIQMSFRNLGNVNMVFPSEDPFAYYFVPVDLPGYFSKHLCSSDVYVDCGSFPGDYSIAVAKMNPDAAIVAVEPDSLNREYLYRVLVMNAEADRVSVLDCALSGCAGESYIVHNKSGSYIQSQMPEDVDSSKVKTVSLDDLLYSYIDNGARIHVKMDIEGAEIPVLKGMKRSLDHGVTFSIASYHNVDGKETRHALKEFFDRNNYSSFVQSPKHLTTIAFPNKL